KTLNGAASISLAAFQSGTWYNVSIKVDVPSGRFDVSLDDKPVASAVAFAEYVKSVERISFRTGVDRTEPTLKTSPDRPPDRVNPNPDIAQPLAIYHVDDLEVTPAPGPR